MIVTRRCGDSGIICTNPYSSASDLTITCHAVGWRNRFISAYEQRMDTLVTHPLFGYRVNYRRVLEIQARLLARVVTGELPGYPGFETR